MGDIMYLLVYNSNYNVLSVLYYMIPYTYIVGR